MTDFPVLTPQGRKAGYIVAVGFVLGGLYQLIFIDYPAKALKNAQDEYQQQLVADFVQANDLSSLNAQRNWYMSAYESAVAMQVTACQIALKALPETAVSLEMSVPEARLRVEALEVERIQAMRLCGVANQQIIDQDTARTRAVSEQAKVATELTRVTVQLEVITSEFQAKSGVWLVQYATPLNDNLQQSESLLVEARKAFTLAKQKLPADDVIEHGDPDGALAVFVTIMNDVRMVRNHADTVERRMTFILKADHEAEPTAIFAKGTLLSLREKVRNVAIETLYTTALHPFSVVLQKLQDNLDVLEATLATGDKVLTYEYGLALQNEQVALSNNLDTFLRTFRENHESIKAGRINEVQFANYADDASRILRTFRSYHANSEWYDVSDIDSTIRAHLSQYREVLAGAIADNGLNEQNPVRSASKLAQANELFSVTQLAYQKLLTRYETLEGYRRSWSDVEVVATRAIEHERSQIERYGSYDSGAESSFESAVSYHKQGVNAANAMQYRDAIDDFNRSKQVVQGVGDRAESSYDDAQRRKRRAAEEAATAVADSFSDHSSSSWSSSFSNDSFSSGDSSSWSSSTSDGGDWGGGSTSNDGGDW